MKYAISHVLAGIALRRMEDISSTEEQIQAKREALSKTLARAKNAQAQLIELTRSHLAELNEGTEYWKAGNAVVLPGSGKVVQAAPTKFELDRDTQQLIDLEARSVQLAAQAETADTQLEQFLRALQAGGESHITQNGLKMSGYPNVRIDRYIIAHNEHRTANA